MSEKKVKEMDEKLKVKRDAKMSTKRKLESSVVVVSVQPKKRKSPLNDCIKSLDATVLVKLKLEKENAILKRKVKALEYRVVNIRKLYYETKNEKNMTLTNYDSQSKRLEEVLQDREIYQSELVNELKLQLLCKSNEYYSANQIIQRIMNTISKAKPFSVVLK